MLINPFPIQNANFILFFTIPWQEESNKYIAKNFFFKKSTHAFMFGKALG
jgi:hypothetical protein